MKVTIYFCECILASSAALRISLKLGSVEYICLNPIVDKHLCDLYRRMSFLFQGIKICLKYGTVRCGIVAF
jgi:hypothetical protein